MVFDNVVVPFNRMKAGVLVREKNPEIALQVLVFCDRPPLRTGLDTILSGIDAEIEFAVSMDDAKSRMQPGNADVAIIDLYSDEAWSGIVFHLFDEIAKLHPVIFICESQEEAYHCAAQSENDIEILLEEAILDRRFHHLLYASIEQGIDGALKPAEK